MPVLIITETKSTTVRIVMTAGLIEMKHHRGSVGQVHNTIQEQIVYLLESRGRKVRKEHEVPSLVESGKSWVIDVADITDPAHPVYYEVELGKSNYSFKRKAKAFAKHTGADMIPIWVFRIPVPMRQNIIELSKWLEEWIV